MVGKRNFFALKKQILIALNTIAFIHWPRIWQACFTSRRGRHRRSCGKYRAPHDADSVWDRNVSQSSWSQVFTQIFYLSRLQHIL